MVERSFAEPDPGEVAPRRSLGDQQNFPCDGWHPGNEFGGCGHPARWQVDLFLQD